MRLADGFVERGKCRIQHAQFGDVREHFPVIQDTDDDTLGFELLIRGSNRQNRHTESDQSSIDLTLDESILR